jgi:hypothetical protein
MKAIALTALTVLIALPAEAATRHHWGCRSVANGTNGNGSDDQGIPYDHNENIELQT